MADPTFLAIQLLNGLQLAALLFMLSVGLSVVFGLLDFLNLAHATFYMVGAYIAVTIAGALDSFWLALAFAPLAVTLIGSGFYFALLRRLRGNHMTQVLVTFGLILVGSDAVRLVWGTGFHNVPEPELIVGSISVLGQSYPAYRFFIIGLGIGIAALLYLGLVRTPLGAIVRAGVDDRETVASLGINVELAFFVTFCIGTWLAGLAGVAAAPVLTVYPGMDVSILILTLIVVVIGGPGSLRGAVVGSLLIGLADTFGKVWFPEFAMMLIYLAMALVLLVRPGGLLPARKPA